MSQPTLTERLIANLPPDVPHFDSLEALRVDAARSATRAGIKILTDDETLARTFEPIACIECQAEGFSPEQCDAFRITSTHPSDIPAARPTLRIVR